MSLSASIPETDPVCAPDRRAPVEPLTPPNPAQRKARHLIPLSRPQPGEQFAFTVDLDRCSGCKACVSACHSLNGLDDDETWRDVGLLIGLAPDDAERPGAPVLQTVTSACHHCLEPACAHGCPVLAYEKDPLTGIVRHLDDQCIGCQYCVLKCPYDVPKYSARRGIVRKCDMCHTRLEAGEAPACVQACPHEAIRIDVVHQADVRAARSAPGDTLVPGAFSSDYTRPTTRYRSARPLPAGARAANAESLRVEHAHAPLVWMLVMTQTAAGLHLLMALLLAGSSTGPVPALAWSAWGLVAGGLLVGFAHLGRPLKAWRAFLGWRRSWMSREILLFTLYAALATALLLAPGSTPLAASTALAGTMGVLSSAMIYIDTPRRAWVPGLVLSRFGGTMLAGLMAGGLAWATLHRPGSVAAWALGCLAALVAAGLAEWVPLHRARSDRGARLHGMMRLLQGPLRKLWIARIGLWSAAALMVSAAAVVPGRVSEPWAFISASLLLGGCILERYGFFMACPSPRMPGGVES